MSENNPKPSTDDRPFLPYPERTSYHCVRFSLIGCKCAVCNPPYTVK